MARVFTTVPGAVVVIQGFGEASNETPCQVPAEVAAQYANSPDFRVEDDEPAEPTEPEPDEPAEGDDEAEPKTKRGRKE